MLVDCMSDSFRLRLLAARHSGRGGVWGCENIQRGRWSRRTKKGKEIGHEVGGEFERTGDMVHGLIRIIAQDERIRGKGF
jgi:hypothetical protein